MSMKSNRGNLGFTMAELLATIAIIGIVSAIAFVSIAQYQRAAYQTEMDETAKEIYIAAQNHLTVANSLGTLPTGASSDTASKKTQGQKDEVTSEAAQAGAGIYYYVVPANADGSTPALSNKKTMLATMLPEGSIDETVRTRGSYIIRYQSNATTARVLDVFYSQRSSGFLQSGFAHTFSDADFPALFAQGANYRDEGDAGATARADYNGAIIGYYGGADAGDNSEKLAMPMLEVRNAEELVARLTNPDKFGADVKFEFYAIGVTSGAVSEPIVADKTKVITREGASCIEAVFDSVTKEDAHFAQLESINDAEFMPGENIRIQVFALDSNATKVSKSAKRTTNSLFASVSTSSLLDLIEAFKGLVSGGQLSTQAVLGAHGNVAKVANIRHLENLSTAVSGYDPAALGSGAPASYEQTANLSWPDFCKAVVGLDPSEDGTMPDDTADSLAVQVHPLTGEPTEAHTYLPVDWANGALEYKGNALQISGIEVSASADAGVFGSVENATIENLEIVNPNIATTGGNAGALAGTMTDSTLANVFVHDEADNAALGVTASANAGGLVGAMTGGSVAGCAAAEYVSGGAAAGGLVGSASNTSLSYSYAGGHTTNGTYEGGRYASNVQGGTAGGFAGVLSGGSAEGCYSTCSVEGDTAGGFVGSNGASLSNCYAVGDVNGQSWGITDVFGNALSTAAYDAQLAGGIGAAVPYDATLSATYGGKYSFKTIAEIPGAADVLGLPSASETTLVVHLNAHYGDWPAVVTLVVNR